MSSRPPLASYNVPLQYQNVEFFLQKLAGRILTICDASSTEPTKNKAMKDLVRREFMHIFNELQIKASDGKAGHSVPITEEI